MYFENSAGSMTSAQLTCLPYGTAIAMRSMLEDLRRAGGCLLACGLARGALALAGAGGGAGCALAGLVAALTGRQGQRRNENDHRAHRRSSRTEEITLTRARGGADRAGQRIQKLRMATSTGAAVLLAARSAALSVAACARRSASARRRATAV